MACFIQVTSSGLRPPSPLCGEGQLGQRHNSEAWGLVVPSLLHAVEKVPNGRMRSFA
jgi:hypothetical protein